MRNASCYFMVVMIGCGMRLIYSLILVTMLTSCAGRPIVNAQNATLTSSEFLAQGKIVPVSEFTMQDEIRFITTFTWSPPDKPGGRHLVVWKWYHDGVLVSVSQKDFVFAVTPFSLWDDRTALSLWQGHFRVETYVTDMKVSSAEFDIKA